MFSSIASKLELLEMELTQSADLDAEERLLIEFLLKLGMSVDELVEHFEELEESSDKKTVGDLVAYIQDRDQPYVWSTTAEFEIEYRVTSDFEHEGEQYFEGDIVTLVDLGGPSVEIDTAVFVEDGTTARFESGLLVDGDSFSDTEWSQRLDDVGFKWTEPVLGQVLTLRVTTLE